MAITKASIVAFLQKAFNETALGADTTTYDVALQSALDEISSSFEILKSSDDTQSLDVDDYEISYPSDMIPGGLISISLKDSAGNVYQPLEPFRGGLKEFRYALDNDLATGRPEYYVDANENAKWFVWRAADQSYSVLIEYFKYHPADLDNIVLPACCKLQLQHISAYHEALLRGNTKYLNTWQPHYIKAMSDIAGMFPGQVRGVYDA